MFLLAKSPDSLIQIFTRLCLSQVKEQLTENLIYTVLNPESFICNGHLYCFIHNKSVIMDETLPEYQIERDRYEQFN